MSVKDKYDSCTPVIGKDKVSLQSQYSKSGYTIDPLMYGPVNRSNKNVSDY